MNDLMTHPAGSSGVPGIPGMKPARINGIITHGQERILAASAGRMILAPERPNKRNPVTQKFLNISMADISQRHGPSTAHQVAGMFSGQV